MEQKIKRMKISIFFVQYICRFVNMIHDGKSGGERNLGHLFGLQTKNNQL